MKILFTVFLCLVLVSLIVPTSFVLSQGDGDLGIDNPLEFGTLGEFVKALVTTARDIGILVAVVGIVYAGFLKVTAMGDEEKLKKANKSFLWAVIGTAIMLGAWLIAFSIQGTVNELSGSTNIFSDKYVIHTYLERLL